MKKLLGKRNIRSAHHAIKTLYDHHAQKPAGSFEDKNAEPSEIRIAQFIAYVDQIKQPQTDGYWSVLREL